MKTSLLMILLWMSSVLQACESAHAADGCQYDGRGIQFTYPSDWKISDEGGWFGPSYVFVENEDSGIVMLLIFPADETKPLKKFAVEYSVEARGELLMGSFEEGVFSESQRVAGETQHEGVKEEFDMLFMQERYPHTREYYVVESTEKSVYLIMQVMNDELKEGERGLDQILGSLKIKPKS